MAVFSTNQTRHLYVAKKVETGGKHVVPTDPEGTIAVHTDKDKKSLFFEYKGVDNLMRSDLIDVKDILYAKSTHSSKMKRPLKSVAVTLDADINGGKPVSGQDYILRLVFKQFVGMSDADQYFKYGMVHAYAKMEASDFYKKLAISLAKNFSREATELVKFSLIDNSGDTEELELVTATTKEEALTGTYTGVIIDEVEQDWVLGKKSLEPVYFDVFPSTITVDGDEVIWGKVEEVKADEDHMVGNGKKIADLEYFCMGERGDIYRGVGYPHNIETTYLVDPTKEYHTIDIHYAYVGSNESVQKSEKDITIVFSPEITVSNLNQFISELNTAADLNIATL